MHSPKNTPFWWEAAQPQTPAQGPLPTQIDVVIVGAGYTGLGAAIPLARSGRQVLVLDRMSPGEGASTRNGGITSGNIRWSFGQLKTTFGEDKARAIYGEQIAARGDLHDFINAHGVQCDFQPVGRFAGALTPKLFEGQKREAELLYRGMGIESQIIERADQHGQIGSDRYFGGVRRPDMAGLHPAKLHHEMTRIAEQAGADIRGNTGVEHIRRKGKLFEIKTTRGTLCAQDVIVATNGYTDHGTPWLRRRLVPVVSEVIATEPLDPDVMDRLMPTRQMYSETRQLAHYFRPSPDGRRIIFGGRRYHNDPVKAREILRQQMLRVFPELKDRKITHHWFGYVAYPTDQLPKLSVKDGVIYAAGFCGSGVVWARWMGQKAAGQILRQDGGTSAFDAPFRAIPFYRGKPWFLPGMIGWYNFQDWRAGIKR